MISGKTVWDVDARRDNHVKLQEKFISVRLKITDEQGSRAWLVNTGETHFVAG
jgi:hypothetical protein